MTKIRNILIFLDKKLKNFGFHFFQDRLLLNFKEHDNP